MDNRLLIRPANISDLNQFLKLIRPIDVGLTTLPKSSRIIEQKIEQSQISFNKNITKPKDEYYLLVMEDQTNNTIIGCSAIQAIVGYNLPFYSYKISKIVNTNKKLNFAMETKLLNLVNDYQGVTELISLYLAKPARNMGYGKALSLARLLFIARSPERFATTVIAELHGLLDSNGNSPFWQHVIQKFFNIDFAKADYLTGIGEKQFIADLMPKHPIYINLLPKAAQTAIGATHAAAQAAYKLLIQQGFSNHNYVDIFDAGPTLEAELSQILAIRNSIILNVKQITTIKQSQEKYLIATVTQEFRATIANINIIDDQAIISETTAKLLNLSPNTKIRIFKL